MATNLVLQGKKIVVTRPERQSYQLTSLIEQRGGEAIVMPVIDIAPMDATFAQLQLLSHQDFVIFISRNAVTHLMRQISVDTLAHCCCVAIGEGTAKAMTDAGLTVSIKPDGASGSEGLLAMVELQQLQGKQVMIVRGQGGRELLADILVERGANVEYIEVYQRVIASPSLALRNKALNADSIICTSVAGVENLFQLLHTHSELLFSKHLIVVSQRIEQVAVNLGFKRISVANNVSDTDIMHQLIKMEN